MSGAEARPAGRGPAGWVERSWSGGPGSLPWTLALAPAAALYAAAAGIARRRAVSARRPVSGLFVLAVGNLTVGGTGKSSLARWLARSAVATGGRAALILRGHGSEAARGRRTGAVPDAPAYPLARAARAYGDEAAAHRGSLPRSVAVLADPDRHRAARVARDGYGASVAVLDDGWEQRTLAWDELWVAVDPRRPAGNGWPIPAGPLRRPLRTLSEATAIAFVLEGADERVPESTLAAVGRLAPRAAVVRFRRALLGPAPATGTRAALVTGVGAPERVTRFARAAGYDVVAHEAFPDHARVGAGRLRAALARAASRGAAVALLTEKDEHRWAIPADAPLPCRVLRATIEPLDPVEPLLERLRASAAGRVS